MKKDIKEIFDTQTQPLWIKMTKIIGLLVVGIAVFQLLGTDWFFLVFGALLQTGIIVHFTYRYKTRSFTVAWGNWYPKDEREEQIGRQYYLSIFTLWVVFTIVGYFLFL